MMEALKDYFFGFLILLRTLIGLFIMTLIVQVPHQYQRFFIYRHRCQLKDRLSMNDYIAFYKDMIKWCDENDIEFIQTFANDTEYNFKDEADAVAFKIMWAEWVK